MVAGPDRVGVEPADELLAGAGDVPRAVRCSPPTVNRQRVVSGVDPRPQELAEATDPEPLAAMDDLAR